MLLRGMELNTSYSAPSLPSVTMTAEVDMSFQLNRQLHILIYLNRAEEAKVFMSTHADHLGEILDCNKSSRCPLETALHRKNFELAHHIYILMKGTLTFNRPSELFIKHYIPFLQQLIENENQEAVRFILETCAKEDPEQGVNVRFVGKTAVQLAKGNSTMKRFLIDEVGCADDSDTTTTFSSSDSRVEMVSRASSLASSTGHKKRGSGPRFHLDIKLHSRSRSTSTSPKGSSHSLSQPVSPKGNTSGPPTPKTLSSASLSSRNNSSGDSEDKDTDSEDSVHKHEKKHRRLSGSSPRILFSRSKESGESKESK